MVEFNNRCARTLGKGDILGHYALLSAQREYSDILAMSRWVPAKICEQAMR